MNLASDFRSESAYNLRALFRSTWMNSLGGEWLLGAQIGSQQAGETEFYQPLDKRHTTFLRPYANTSLGKAPLYFEGSRADGGYFHEAGTAFTSAAFQWRVIAHRWRRHITTYFTCSLQNTCSWLHFNGDVVDGYFKKFLFFSHY